MTVADIQAKSESWNMRVIGHHDLNGHGDGMQILKQGRYVYLAHLGTSPMALSIIDAADYFPGSVRLSKGALPHNARVHLADPKGGDPSEWPAELRVRQFPEPAGVMSGERSDAT